MRLPFSSICFNPRICKRCDSNQSMVAELLTVSIHASVKDATVLTENFFMDNKVSIHASVKDATVNTCNRIPLE